MGQKKLASANLCLLAETEPGLPRHVWKQPSSPRLRSGLRSPRTHSLEGGSSEPGANISMQARCVALGETLQPPLPCLPFQLDLHLSEVGVSLELAQGLSPCLVHLVTRKALSASLPREAWPGLRLSSRGRGRPQQRQEDREAASTQR